MKYQITRPAEGITINEESQVLCEGNKPLSFDSEQEAIQFLIDEGMFHDEQDFRESCLTIEPCDEERLVVPGSGKPVS